LPPGLTKSPSPRSADIGADSTHQKAMEKAVSVLKATGTSANGEAFRFDINALRAFSVIAVVGYHFQIPDSPGDLSASISSW
jgi:hypothetical protein